jgi:hypothetical protein
MTEATNELPIVYEMDREQKNALYAQIQAEVLSEIADINLDIIWAKKVLESASEHSDEREMVEIRMQLLNLYERYNQLITHVISH